MSGRQFMAAVDRLLYPATVGYTLVILGFVFYEFSQGGRYQLRLPFGDVYLVLLTAYAAQREGSKWFGADEAAMRIRRGEIFVGIWLAVYLFMAAMANVSTRWAMPSELKTITLGVLGIFVATGVSSGIRSRLRPLAGSSSVTADRRAEVLQLVEARGSVSAEEVMEALTIPKTSAWRILETLEKEGVLRQDDSSDSRNRRYRRSS